MPPSYYNDTSKGELRSDQFRYLYFRFNNLTILPENIMTYCNQIFNNKYIPIENLSDIDSSRLADKTFIKIIDFISKSKAINNDK